MARPSLISVSQGMESWDAVINDDLKVLGRDGDPVPLPEFASEGALPAANLFDRCVSAVNNAQGWTLYISNGVSWLPLARRGVAVADSTAPDVATLVLNFNTLLSSLRAAGVIAP